MTSPLVIDSHPIFSHRANDIHFHTNSIYAGYMYERPFYSTKLSLPDKDTSFRVTLKVTVPVQPTECYIDICEGADILFQLNPKWSEKLMYFKHCKTNTRSNEEDSNWGSWGSVRFPREFYPQKRCTVDILYTAKRYNVYFNLTSIQYEIPLYELPEKIRPLTSERELRFARAPGAALNEVSLDRVETFLYEFR